MNKKILMKYLAAFTYGNGHITKKSPKYSKFETACLSVHEDYVDWQANILRNLTSVSTYPIYIDESTILKLQTKQHPTYSKIRARMYLNNRKVLDPHYLKLFDWETLAVVYMDIGELKLQPILNTFTFSYAENLMLKHVIKDKLDLEFNVVKYGKDAVGRQYILRLSNISCDKFINGITPFILPSFQYKIRT